MIGNQWQRFGPRIGMRVKVNETFPYGRHGEVGTIETLPQNGKAKWLGVRFDENPLHIAEWHMNYFDPVRQS